MTHKFLLAAALSAGGLASMTAPSTALPFAPYGPAVFMDNVAFGCGPGFRPNEWGRCVPMRPWESYPQRYYRDGDRGEHHGWDRGSHRGWDDDHHRGWRRDEHRGWDGDRRGWRDDDDD